MEIDCEDCSATLNCVSAIFNCNESELRDTLLSIDIHHIYNKNGASILIPPEQYLLDYVCRALGQPNAVDSVCWFHTTRTTTSNNYENGILPLGQVIGDIWDTLIDLAPDKNIKKQLQKLQASGHGGFQYTLKVPNKIHWGPYGILVKQVAFHANNLGQHDYLGMPEIIEDILSGCSSGQLDLLEHYSKEFVPKIVKFRSQQGIDYVLNTALCYAHDCAWGYSPKGWSVTCFDGGNSVVQYNNIIKVEAC